MRQIETEREDDGRWIAEDTAVPGVLAYGDSREEAIRKVVALSRRVIDERLEYGEPLPPSVTPRRRP